MQVVNVLNGRGGQRGESACSEDHPCSQMQADVHNHGPLSVAQQYYQRPINRGTFDLPQRVILRHD
jgi:hypothetical protein